MTYQESPADLRKLKGSLILTIAGMSIPILVLIDLRFLLAYGYVSPSASRILGSIATLLLLVSALTVGLASRATAARKLSAAKNQFVYTMFLGLVSWVLIGVQVVNHSVNPLTNFGETFRTTLGTLDVYILIGWIALLAGWTRLRRLQTETKWWGIFATARVWQFIVISWTIIYIVFYWI